MRADLLQQLLLEQGMLVAAFDVARDFLLALADGLQVGQHELRGDDLDVPHRVNVAGHVCDVGILEAAHDVNERVHLADMAEELIAQALAVGGALDQPGDIHELEGRGNLGADLGDLGELGQSRLRHTDYAQVGLDRAERVVLGRSLVRAGDGVEERGFPYIR